MGINLRWTRGWMAPLLLIGATTALGEEAAAPAEAAPAATEAPATAPAADEAGEAAAAPAPAEPVFSSEQLDQMVAPIALYPDALIAQILMASTYPLEIVQAARWLKKHADLEGEALDKAAAKESWDPSVQALVFFPGVLQRMSDNLDWTQDLGDAVLAQQQDVLDTVQKLRQEAMKAGNLESTPQQTVEKKEDNIIIIQPADPKVVYVPTYNPTTVYAQPPPPTNYYPAVYTAPPPATTTTTVVESSSSGNEVLAFGAGALVGGLLTAAIMWNKDDHHHHYNNNIYYGGRGRWGGSGYWGGGHNNVDINIGKVNIGNKVGNRWQHNPRHRGGVKYRSPTVGKRYTAANTRARTGTAVATGRARSNVAGGRVGAGISRDQARGYNRQATKARTPVKVSRDAKPRTRPAGGQSIRRSGAGEGRARTQVQRQARPQSSISRPTPRAKPRTASRPATSVQQRARTPGRASRQAKSTRSSNAFRVQGNARSTRAASSRGNASRAARRSGHAGSGGGRLGRGR